MSHGDILVWAFFTLDGIAPDQKCHVCGFRLEVWIPARFANRHMAAIAACVRYRVADLAGERISMLFVHEISIARGNIFVTVGAFWIFCAAQAVFR